MTTANLKIDIINKITQLENTAVIKELQRVIDFELETGIFKTTAEQKRRIKIGEAEIKAKKTISEAQANKEIAQWLGE